MADFSAYTSSGPVTVSYPNLDAADARSFVVGQMSRTRAARTRELSPRPPLHQPSTVTLIHHEEGAGN
ncbi:hypothetical protein [Cutibacterium namnetense]|uniref:hypothetical protein n=1 Tax=Cutibacterium namnetense TaxID=1574624 RepID=UPI0027957140|nr:hypothetical protein [Cutibacterium namnetense]